MGGALSEDFPAYLAGLREGSLLAGYRLEAQLGAGAMALVFRAHDERLKRPVALKVFAPTTAADRAARRRFIAESRAAAAVDHPHIIPVYDADEVGGLLFIAMRLVRGGDLRGLLERQGVLPPARAAGIVSQVASALDAAHGAGLVHRDVKPANILLAEPAGEPDYVYLSDFGVSKQATRSTNLTGTGQFLGTPDYAAPEQGRNLPVDGRADQYALACVAYHLLTGTPPFEREGPWAVLMAHQSEPPPSVRARRPELPEAVDRVLARALAKVPEKRYGSCREFAGALRAALGLTPGRAAVPAGPPTVASTDWASLDRPANRSRQATQATQATQASSAPAKGSSLLLQPTPPGAGPSRPGRSATDRSRGVLRLGGWGLAILMLAAVGLAGFMLATHHSPKRAPASDQSPAVVPLAGPPVNPAQQPPGVSRQIERIAAAGNTIVTTGSQHSGGLVHQQFFVSDDGGATWYLAPMQRPGASPPTAGHVAARIAGGPRGWLAEGPQAIWASKDGLSWTLAATHGISPQHPGDNIAAVAATADGFLATGGTGKAGGNQAVIWISHGDTTWQRLTATQLGLKVAGITPTNIQYATSQGNDTLISDGSGVWLSTDGGTSWTQVTVPVGHGARDQISGLSFDGSGLIAVRPGTGASGAPGGVAYFSPNGQVWQFAGLIDPVGGWTPQVVKGSDYGFVVVGYTSADQNVAYASTGTGATWRPTKSLGSTSDTSINSATVGSGGTVIAVGSVGQHVVFIKTSPEP
jgi:serine/threonine protein kinase